MASSQASAAANSAAPTTATGRGPLRVAQRPPSGADTADASAPGTAASPVSRAVQPHTLVANRTRHRLAANSAAPNAIVPALDARTQRVRRSAGSSTGAAIRRVRATSSPPIASAAANVPSVAARGPAPRLALDERERQRAGGAGQQDGAGHVGRRGLDRARLAQPAQAEPDGEQADRHVDHEDPAPAAGLHEQAAERRAERGRHGADRAPGGDRGRPLLRREGGEQERQGGRDHRRRADALDGAGGDQRARRGRHGTGARGDREQRDTAQIDPAAADPVGRAAEHHEQRREGQRVGVDHPRERAEAGAVEVARDVGEGDVDDRHVEVREERAADGEPERRPRAGAVGRRLGESEPVGGRAGELGHVGRLLGRKEYERSCEVLSKDERSCYYSSGMEAICRAGRPPGTRPPDP